MRNSVIRTLIPYLDDNALSFRLRKQLPYLALVSMTLGVIFAIMIPAALVSAGTAVLDFVGALAALTVLLGAALALLHRGSYRSAAILITCALFGSALSVMYLMPYSGRYEIYRVAAFFAVMAVCNVLIAIGRNQMKLFYYGFLIVWVLGCLTIFRPYFAEDFSKTAVIAGINFFAISLENLVLSFIKRLSDDLLETAERETSKAQETLSSLTRILAEAREGMEIGSRIIDASRRVEEAVAQIDEIQRYLAGVSEKLMTESETFAVSSRTVTESTRAVKENLADENAAITQTSSAITEISSNLASISDIARNRRALLDELSAAGSSQKELIKKLVGTFDSVRKSSEGIGLFVHTVQDIASRTGLLSMNASIEAARAGAAGKGFAVVAQEIRALSEETQKNATTIKGLLGENEKTILATDGMMHDFSDFIEKNVSEMAALLDSIDEILAGIGEMDTGTREVMKSVDEIVKSAGNSKEQVNTVSAQIDTQREGFSHIAAFSAELHSRIGHLEAAVRQIAEASALVSDAGRKNTEQVKKLQTAAGA